MIRTKPVQRVLDQASILGLHINKTSPKNRPIHQFGPYADQIRNFGPFRMHWWRAGLSAFWCKKPGRAETTIWILHNAWVGWGTIDRLALSKLSKLGTRKGRDDSLNIRMQNAWVGEWGGTQGGDTPLDLLAYDEVYRRLARHSPRAEANYAIQYNTVPCNTI